MTGRKRETDDERPEERRAQAPPEEKAAEAASNAQGAGDIDVEAEAADLAKLRSERDEYLQAAQRARADYLNLQRRVRTEIEAARENERAAFALAMLDILDDLERALEHAREAGESGGLVDGVALVREKFLKTLERYEIRPIKAEGEHFDPNFHDAIARQPTTQAPEGTVLAVVQKGYTMAGKLLRPARVVVAVEPEDPEKKADDKE